MTSCFVTGTDTDVGKTVVAAILARGLRTDYWKPVQTGKIRDSEFVGRWIGSDRVHPEAYLLAEPLSPHEAARRSDVRIRLDQILLRRPIGPLVVEGAGGALVPLNEECKMVDLMQALRLPAVVVARSSLGTINHTLLTLEALRSRHVHVLGVVLVGPPQAHNRTAIEEFGDVRVLGEIDLTPKFSEEWLDQQFEKLWWQGEPTWPQLTI